MKWSNLILVALRGIAKNKMRSLLTMLGMIIGVGAVIALVALGSGSQADIQSQVAGLGTNLLMIRPVSTQSAGVRAASGSMSNLSLADVAKLKQHATLLSGVSGVVRVQEQVIAGRTNWNTTVMGVGVDYQGIRNYTLESGAYFTERDVKTSSKVAILGKTVADALFPGQDPIGVQMRIRNVPFKIIGVLASKGESSMGSDQDDIILAPVTTILYRLSDGKTVRDIVASARSEEEMAAAKIEIITLMREAHRLPVGSDDDVLIRDQSEINTMATKITSTLTMLLSAVAGVSLLVGGIGIMNIMLVSVTERTREIGIRMAVGARPGDILIQFLIEAVILSLIGGMIGIACGIGSASLLGALLGSSVVVSPGIVIGSVGFTALVGIFFGFYPARKASQLNPIEALRFE
ncbi:MAG: multidrug ABC transporter substrate-binding protein [Deltaproteobacteria bacterium HGW-Deltaproteobacteria-4]|nr:MAG: multidrug ABC transporter substrate-binding protein [Deltaproteobacteria bacterium HGW-Deltaproteobacteria-4]